MSNLLRRTRRTVLALVAGLTIFAATASPLWADKLTGIIGPVTVLADEPSNGGG